MAVSRTLDGLFGALDSDRLRLTLVLERCFAMTERFGDKLAGYFGCDSVVSTRGAADLTGECTRIFLNALGGIAICGSGVRGDFTGETGNDCAVFGAIGRGVTRIICGEGGGCNRLLITPPQYLTLMMYVP